MAYIKNFILLHPNDNILVCCQKAKVGELIDVNGEKLTLMTDIELGHKVAKQTLNSGEKIMKYGVSIGSAIQHIKLGEHVHLHNMKSDYIPPHTREQTVGSKK